MFITLAETVFFIASGLIIYTYVGYGILMQLAGLLKKRKPFPALADEDLPRVAHIIAAYNEEDFITAKIENSLALDYPTHLLDTIIVTDGSTDNTCHIVAQYPRVRHIHLASRNGKLAAVNRAMELVQAPITFFSDANTELNSNAIRHMVMHFQNNLVGAVAGEKVVFSEKADDASASGEGFYWKYESWLKRLDYQLNTVVGAAGELFAVRTHLYESPSSQTLIEDFVTAMTIARKGYIVAYEPQAKAKESASASIKEESKRKVRISAGGLQAIVQLKALLNPFQFGTLTFQYVSHRVLRWTVAPVCLVLVFISNLVLAQQGNPLYEITIAVQFL
ncbi:MAG: glycosyltransferase family 2 protein, partial [Cyclobacteriaceae bacterium]|nr:glycosyltransferase family 2 protein [Cyclobacteriaceae bacterium HetDA_MAG_MS6]